MSVSYFIPWIGCFICLFLQVSSYKEGTCLQPVEKGRCKAFLSRHFYNWRTKKCERFTYKRCGGNDNKFKSKEACEKVCADRKLTKKERCSLPRKKKEIAFGHRMMCISFRYDRSAGKCVHFSCTSILVTKNSFEKKAECQKACSDLPQCEKEEPQEKLPEGCYYHRTSYVDGAEDFCGKWIEKCEVPSYKEGTCLQPAEKGSCKDKKSRLFYNWRTEKCEGFTYGGCGGNDNNFELEEACQEACANRNLTKKERYDRSAGKCTRLIYGGSGGTKNLFDTQAECQDACSDLPQCQEVKPQEKLPKGCYYHHTSYVDGAKDFCGKWIKKCEALSYDEGTCLQPAEKGSCKGTKHRHFYNWRTKKCEEFTYGGCGGNDNNFESKEACQQVCTNRTLTKKERCSLPRKKKVIAFGHRMMCISFRYDRSAGKCVHFSCTSILETKNSFKKKAECQKACSDLPKCEKEKPQKKLPEGCYYYRTSYVDGAKDFCGKWIAKCHSKGVCVKPAEKGSCDDIQDRFFYNWRTKKCEQFTYGGCGGNDNNFESKETCQQVCADRKLTKWERCSLPLKRNVDELTGRKMAHIRFRYDRSAGECVTFIYRGSGGTENRFDKEAECQRACSGLPKCRKEKPEEKLPEGCDYHRSSYVDGAKDFCGKWILKCHYYMDGTCLQPAEKGSCKSTEHRRFYNWRTKKCEQFKYGGCGGNDNNFESKETCQTVCANRKLTRKERCSLPVKSGDNGWRCSMFKTRYRYDRSKRKCVRTQYGGCNGTENLFDTKAQCRKACSGLPRCRKGKPKKKLAKGCDYHRTSYIDGGKGFCGKWMEKCEED